MRSRSEFDQGKILPCGQQHNINGSFFYYICCFSIFPSNFIHSESGVTICSQFWIRRLDTWRHRPRDHSTRDGSFPIGGHLDPSLFITVSEIFRPKNHVLVDTMLYRHCACAISRDMYPYVKFKYIFQFLTSTLPIHCVTFIGLRWRIRGVLSLDL